MISDVGNKLNTVKFNVWLKNDGSGYITFAAEKGSLPGSLSREDKRKSFWSLAQVSTVMESMRQALRQAEKQAEQERTQGHQSKLFKFECRSCRTAITEGQAFLTTYKHPVNGSTTGLILSCKLCGGINLQEL